MIISFKSFETIKWYKDGKFIKEPEFKKPEFKEPEFKNHKFDDFITNDEFRDFLIDNDCYEEYINNYDHSIDFNKMDMHEYISRPFSWRDSPEKHEYWQRLHEKWYDRPSIDYF